MHVQRPTKSHPIVVLRTDTIHSGRSVVSQDCTTIAASNQLDGVDWYSLSSFKLISSSKIPISKGSSVSSLVYADGDNAVVIGGLSGLTYIVDCQTFDVRQELEHNGVYSTVRGSMTKTVAQIEETSKLWYRPSGLSGCFRTNAF